MVRDAIKEFGLEDLDLLILENIGNLVCPAEFDTGSHANMVLLSVPEGDDKPLKYPLMFEVADFVVITKIDVMPIFDFSITKATENIHKRNSAAQIFSVSSLKDEGVKAISDYLKQLINN